MVDTTKIRPKLHQLAFFIYLFLDLLKRTGKIVSDLRRRTGKNWTCDLTSGSVILEVSYEGARGVTFGMGVRGTSGSLAPTKTK